jgi:hypothetical protein
LLYVFVVIEHSSRRLLHFNGTSQCVGQTSIRRLSRCIAPAHVRSSDRNDCHFTAAVILVFDRCSVGEPLWRRRRVLFRTSVKLI